MATFENSYGILIVIFFKVKKIENWEKMISSLLYTYIYIKESV